MIYGNHKRKTGSFCLARISEGIFLNNFSPIVAKQKRVWNVNLTLILIWIIWVSMPKTYPWGTLCWASTPLFWTSNRSQYINYINKPLMGIFSQSCYNIIGFLCYWLKLWGNWSNLKSTSHGQGQQVAYLGWVGLGTFLCGYLFLV